VSLNPPGVVLEDVAPGCTVGFGLTVKFAAVMVEPVVVTVGAPIGVTVVGPAVNEAVVQAVMSWNVELPGLA
jgi:hypothetical protein